MPRTRFLALTAIALLAPAVSEWATHQVPALHRAELLVYDWHAGALPRLPADDRIVLVGMDQESLGHLPLERTSYPLPRSIHARVVDELRRAGAAVVAFDVFFSRPMPREDADFASALQSAPPVLCGVEPHVRVAAGVEEVTFTPPADTLRGRLTACSILAPPMLGKIRWFMPATIDVQSLRQYRHVSVALAEALGGKIANAPRGGDGEILIRFAGPANTYRPVPLYQVFDGSWRSQYGPDLFRGKAVLIGVIDPLVDRALTPVGDLQGVEVLAQAAQTVLQGNWIRHWSEAANGALALVLCLAMTWSIWGFGFRWAWALLALESIGCVFAAHLLFVRTQVWVDSVGPAFALVLAMTSATVYEAGRVRRVFRRFMPSKVAEGLLRAAPQDATREIEATIVFCDIRNSTRLTETLSADRMLDLLRRYFTAGEDSARRLGAELDKFVGDEIMLYFESRPRVDDHALRAVRWAFDMHRACADITASGLAGDVGFHVGIGICSGPVRIGTVGARQRIQHTVIGDAVNTASRLQSLTKDLREPTIVASSTWERVSEAVEGRHIGVVPIRGKEQPMSLYAPVRVR